jgi:ribosome modulation factor
LSEPIFPIARVLEIRQSAREAHLRGKTEADCPYRLIGQERELWLTEFRKAATAEVCA